MEIEVVRSLVRTILEQAPEFDGRGELLDQVATINVVTGPVTMLELSVDRSLPPPGRPMRGPVPGNCWAMASDGAPIGSMRVWANEGFVETLEFGWVTDDPPTGLPAPSTLTTDG